MSTDTGSESGPANTPKPSNSQSTAFLSMQAKAGLPKRHCDTEVERSGPWTKTYAELSAMLGTGTLCAMLGPRGTGKTRMAVSLARKVISAELQRPDRPVSDTDARRPPPGGWRLHAPVVYIKAMSLFLSIREAYRKEGPTEIGVLGRFRAPRLLIVDEIQERANSEWEDRMLVHLVDLRYDDRKDTVLIGNLKPDDLAASLGTSIISRIREAGTVVECCWPSFRP